MRSSIFICSILLMFWSCRAHHLGHSPKLIKATYTASQDEQQIRELHFYGLVALREEMNGNAFKARAARLAMEKIEKLLLKERSHQELRQLIFDWGAKSPVYANTLKQLAHKLQLQSNPFKLSRSELMKEITQVKITREFQVFESNVEHLSYILESNARL